MFSHNKGDFKQKKSFFQAKAKIGECIFERILSPIVQTKKAGLRRLHSF